MKYIKTESDKDCSIIILNDNTFGEVQLTITAPAVKHIAEIDRIDFNEALAEFIIASLEMSNNAEDISNAIENINKLSSKRNKKKKKIKKSFSTSVEETQE